MRDASDWCSGVRLSLMVLTVCSVVVTYHARSQVVTRSTYAATRRVSRPIAAPATPGAIKAPSTPGRMLLDAGRLRVHINSLDGRLEIINSHGTQVAASSAASPYVRSGGDLQQLVLKAASTNKGCDVLGCFSTATLEWSVAPGNTTSPIVTLVRAYAALGAVVFSTRFLSAVHGTS